MAVFRRRRDGHPPAPAPYAGAPQPYPQDPSYGAPYDPYTTAPQPRPEPAAPPPPPPLRWQELLTGILFRPDRTFWHMRDYAVWWPALIVTFLYGLVAVFGLDEARESILETTASTVAPYLLVTGAAMVLGALVLSTVTHNLARQFGGNGIWAPTAGLAMLIMTLTDVPRLALAIFLGGANPVVQIVGWVTWLYAGFLFTLMVSRSHEIAWPRALASSTIQLLALLMLVKLGTL
ncbi:Yip1 family protein [Streptomyces marincola]|uniref:Yip1 family protein n=1 Tax=Streptomyces marincola TaxID=2878388 RepID=UPI001CF2482E|nr:Yip1 family protein [Streptomyces marincola]UCM89281.1 YIP1 family protein [Streptomyces marincola]